LNLVLLTIGLSLLLTYSFVPIANKIGSYYKLLDFPDFRKNHKVPIVRIGGLGIFSGWLFSLLIILKISPLYFNLKFINSQFSFFELAICSFLFFLIGFADDIKRLSPYVRLILQFSVASICWGSGLSINYLNLTYLNLQPIQLTVLLSFLITTFFIVGLINAVNWWDGLDGLATGTTLISTFVLLLINLNFYNYQPVYTTLLIASFLGSLIGFLIHNYNPAKILMGDGGSYFLGFSLANLVLINSISGKSIRGQDFDKNHFPLITIIVVLPLLIDMVKVIYLRLISFKLLFKPDRLHLHHNLLQFGFSEKETVIQMYAIVLMISSFAFLFIDIKFSNLYFSMVSIVFITITFLNFKNKLFNSKK